MRHSSSIDSRAPKQNARKQYIDRQIDKWVQWSWRQRGKVKYKELISEIERITKHAGKRR
mgnify:CR=1 FL=1